MKPEQLPQGADKTVKVRAMFDRIAPTYEKVNKYISFGMDAHWRNIAVSRLGLALRSTVIDLACGTGDFCRLLAERGHDPIGVDLSLGMLEAAQVTGPLVQADASALPFRDASVDGVTCGFGMRNFVDLRVVFAECARVLRPGGRVALLDASLPDNAVVKAGHSLYFGKIVPRIGAVMSKDRNAYEYLPASLRYLPPKAELEQWLRDAGFSEVVTKTFLGGSARLVTATR